MEVANILDIDGSQWELQDQMARHALAEQEVKINNLQENLSITNNKIYVDKSKNIETFEMIHTWVKIGNIYPERNYAPNVFLIGSRRGGIYLLSCSRDDENSYWPPVLMQFYDPLNNIASAKAKDGFIYIQSRAWNSISIQQLNNTPRQITMIKENPPADAIDITIIKK